VAPYYINDRRDGRGKAMQGKKRGIGIDKKTHCVSVLMTKKIHNLGIVIELSR
jgi:hypothetical protein